MAASVKVDAGTPSTVVVTVTAAAGSGYNPGTASVQLTRNDTGVAGPIPTVTISSTTATFTFNPVAAGGYTVAVTCGGETTVSTVTTTQASVGVH